METFDFAFVATTSTRSSSCPAVALAVNSTGHTSVRTVVLIAPEGADVAVAQNVNHVQPGA